MNASRAQEDRDVRGGKIELLGRRLRKLRKQRKWSPDQVAEKAGIDPQEVLRIERGEARVGLETVVRLLAAIRLEPADVEKLADAERREAAPVERYRRDLSS